VERYLSLALKRLHEVCDEVVIGCNATDKATRDFLIGYPNTTTIDLSKYEWGKAQWKIKYTLLKDCIAPKKPDWIVCVDADEVLDKRFTREKAEEMAQRDEIAYTFYCVQLWDREDKMRVDGGWGNFRNVRYFKFLPEASLQYKKTPLHCGLAPLYAYRWRADSEFLFKHYGYMKLEDRERKIARYKKYDPKKVYRSSGWYDSIRTKPSVKAFNEDTFGAKLRYKPRRPRLSKVIIKKIMSKTFYVKNKYGRIYGVREEMLKEHLDRDGISLVGADEYLRVEKRQPPKELKNELQCPICGKICKSKIGLISHKRVHK